MHACLCLDLQVLLDGLEGFALFDALAQRVDEQERYDKNNNLEYASNDELDVLRERL